MIPILGFPLLSDDLLIEWRALFSGNAPLILIGWRGRKDWAHEGVRSLHPANIYVCLFIEGPQKRKEIKNQEHLEKK